MQPVATDGIVLSATARIDAYIYGPVAAVMIIHPGDSARVTWVPLPIFGAVEDAGMFALAFDLPGHRVSVIADYPSLQERILH